LHILKLYSFNACSFSLDANIEELLRSKGAIVLDFGTSAYINSESMPRILSELVAAASRQSSSSNANEVVVACLKAEMGRIEAKCQWLSDENTRLASDLQTSSQEISVLKQQGSIATKTIETLRAENARLQAICLSAPKGLTAAQVPTHGDAAMKQAYEKMQRDLQVLRTQNADAITSLKVLEEENDELREEVEMLRSQIKNTAAPKMG
jgi:chromosome segregation ATPase